MEVICYYWELRKSAGCRREKRDLGAGCIVENLKRGHRCEREQAGVAGLTFIFVGCLSWFSVNVRKPGGHQAAAGMVCGLVCCGGGSLAGDSTALAGGFEFWRNANERGDYAGLRSNFSRKKRAPLRKDADLGSPWAACLSIISAVLTSGVSSVARAVSTQPQRNLSAQATEVYFQNLRKFSFSAHAVPVCRSWPNRLRNSAAARWHKFSRRCRQRYLVSVRVWLPAALSCRCS